jgi:hypothetical protein
VVASVAHTAGALVGEGQSAEPVVRPPDITGDLRAYVRVAADEVVEALVRVGDVPG